MKLIKTLSILTMFVFLLSGCASNAAKSSTNATGSGEGISYQGSIEADEISINSKVPGRIKKVNVKEGQEVKAGDVLVEIESDELNAKKQQAIAQRDAYKAGLEADMNGADAAKAAYDAAVGQYTAAQSVDDKAKNGARKQEIAQAQAAFDLWQKTYERVQTLFEKGAVSAQKVDEVKTQLEVASQQLSMANEGARSEDKMGAEAQVIQAQANVQARASIYEQAKSGVKADEDKVKAAEGAVAEVDAYLKDTLIKAASDGVLTEINSHEGELVSTGVSIGTLSKLKDTWVTVKVKETDLSKISVNQEVEIKVPAFSKSVFKGKVATINQKPDYATKRATNDNGDFDILSYGVKIELSDNGNVLRPGMTAFVQFRK